MRVISAILLFVPIAMLWPSCKSRQSTSLSETQYADQSGDVGLKLGTGGAVLITLTEKYSAASNVGIKFRRGSATHRQEIKCPQIPDDNTFVRLKVDASSRVATGPVPPTMWLKSPYDGFDPNSLTKFSKTSFDALMNGGDALIDVCIWNQGSVLGTATLPFDGSQEFDQLIAGDPTMYHGRSGQTGIALVEEEEQQKADPRTKDPNDVMYVPNPVGKAPSLAEYVAKREQEIGPIPEVNCQQANVIEMFATEPQGNGYYDQYGNLIQSQIRYIVDNNYFKNTPQGATVASTKCDTPAMLGYGNLNQCAPFSRLGRPRVAGKGQWAFVCRRYFGRSKSDPHFDDVNMIGHNPDTGATCFFNSKLNPSAPEAGYDLGRDTTKIPKLASAEATSFWMTPSQIQRAGCANRCHTNDPFIHTPFVDRITASGASIKTCINDSDASNCLVPSNPNGKYKVVYDSYLNWAPRILKPVAQIAACTECHRIGARSYVTFSLQAGGFFGSTGLTNSGFHIWMPPSGHPTEDSKKAIEYLKGCQNNLNTCETEPVDQ
jgi:hypothetical protein